MRYIFACLAAGLLLSESARAETAEERYACIGDAFRLCGEAIPNRERVFACFVEKRRDLSNGCRAVIDQYAPPMRVRKPLRRHSRK